MNAFPPFHSNLVQITLASLRYQSHELRRYFPSRQ